MNKNSRFELITAGIFCIGSVGIWGLGFKLAWIHSVLALIFALLFGMFPLWIVFEEIYD